MATADDQGGGSGVLELGQLNRVVERWCGNVQTVPAVSTYCAPNPSPGDRRTPLNPAGDGELEPLWSLELGLCTQMNVCACVPA